MAQERGGGASRRRRLARLGARISRPQAAALVVGVGLLLALGVWRSLAAGGFTVERADGSAPQAVAQGSAQAPSGQAAQGPGGAEGATASSGEEADAVEVPSRVVVHVDGAVASPGVYELAGSDPRVGDAVTAAGGLAPEADTSTLNLAAKVADGSKVHVPAAGEEAAAPSGQEAAGTPDGTGQAGAAAGTGSPAGAAAGTADGGLVNINTATVEELDSLPGVGPSTAQAIVEDRRQNGPFSSPEDLMRVSGIGEKKFARLEGSICV